MSRIKCTTLPSFLKLHKIPTDDKTSVITHTRIGGKDNNGNIVYGGKYHIPDDKMVFFWKLYYKWVFENKQLEYLTEAQDKINGGPILIDLDLRFNENVKTRQYTQDELVAIIELYSESFQELFDFKETIEFPIYIFEKKSVVCKLGKETKDGIHMIIGLSTTHDIQMTLRNILIQKETNDMKIFGDEGLCCTNKAHDIFDESIMSGRNNWQVTGSQKPSGTAYKLTNIYNVTINNDEYSFEITDIKQMKIREMLPIISAKNKDFKRILDSSAIKSKYKEMCHGFKQKIVKKIKKNKIKKRNIMSKDMINNFKFPRNNSELNNVISETFDLLNLKDYHLKTLHKLVLVLNEAYFNPFKEWMEVGWALHNTSPRYLFWSWVKFSSKSDKFNYGDIPDLYDKWTKMKDEGFTFRSIHYWVKNVNYDNYKKIINESVEQLVYKTLPGGGSDTDIAILAKNLFMGEFACVSLKEKKWYQYCLHRWKISDNGYGLRIKLSQEVEALFQTAAQQEKDKSTDEQYSAGEREHFLQNASAFNRIAQRLKSHNQKKAIMGECMEQFYNDELEKKMDENKYLMGFNNGIYDFNTKTFRQGLPEDYISFSTETDYEEYDNSNQEHIKIKLEIDDFMEKVFPNKELRRYMWDHAASTLIGENRNQKFNIYIGVGGNGKSIWVDLLNLVLGKYSEKMNIALLTQKRKGIGGPTPEITKLKGKRFVSVDEPTRGDKLNEGIMKQLTGGDEIEGRSMYAKEMLKFYPQFELVCCTNNLPTIDSVDKGTWRRIRTVKFVSEFVDDADYEFKKKQGLTNDTEKPIYRKDLTMKDKLPIWAPIFTSLLIKRVNITKGIVKDCPMVLEASREYESKQNIWKQFFNENIEKGCDDDKVKQTEVRNHFNEWFNSENQGGKIPRSQDLYEQLDVFCGKRRKKAWHGWKIIYETYDSEDDN
jgi:P4 family phage/plasmid primase-like protien